VIGPRIQCSIRPSPLAQGGNTTNTSCLFNLSARIDGVLAMLFFVAP
jgi:hypothetical protein